MTEDLSEDVWQEKAVFSFCMEREDVVEDTGNSVYHRGPEWSIPRLEKELRSTVLPGERKA